MVPVLPFGRGKERRKGKSRLASTKPFSFGGALKTRSRKALDCFRPRVLAGLFESEADVFQPYYSN
jgi:hypothetical protein